MDDVLQRAAVLLRLRRQSRENQHRRARDVRVRDAGHPVRYAGPRGDKRDAEPAGHQPITPRPMGGGH